MVQTAFMPINLISWLIAIRPHTLTMTAVPVLVGAALAWNQTGQSHWLAAAVALIGGLLIQAATNLYNDGADYDRGNDGADRLGPQRSVAAGIFTARQVKRMAMALFALSAVAGIYLIYVGGVPILVLGVLSILSGWGYSAGPRPIAYTPFGELFVITFFGLGAVGATCWLAGGHVENTTLLVGAFIGSFAAAVLLVNNFRDVECDTRAGRRTLSIVLGATGSRILYALFMTLPFAALPVLIHMIAHSTVWITYAALPAALYQCWRLVFGPQGRALNSILKGTAQTQLAYGCLLSVGLVV